MRALNKYVFQNSGESVNNYILIITRKYAKRNSKYEKGGIIRDNQLSEETLKTASIKGFQRSCLG